MNSMNSRHLMQEEPTNGSIKRANIAMITQIEHAKNIKIAKLMIADNEISDKIAKYTGLTIEQIHELRNEIVGLATTPHITIRPAVVTDLETLFRFEQGVISAERPFDETLRNDILFHYYDIPTLINSPNAQIVVAVYNNELIASGYARIETSKHYLKHEQHAYLGFMYVQPNYRGEGINEKIMTALKKWSIEQGINELRLEVYSKNEAAIKAYEKAGFKAHLLEMRMEL
jgi:ribosomal protein S18 acetylase RimI-like enzyme